VVRRQDRTVLRRHAYQAPQDPDRGPVFGR
jgi:hypothetical protein